MGKGSSVTDLDKLKVEELDELIATAQEYRRKRKTNPVLVKGFTDSLQKHTSGFLRAYFKLIHAEGVSAERWAECKEQLARLTPDRVAEEAEKLHRQDVEKLKQ